MIIYDKLWQWVKDKGLSVNQLHNKYEISKAQISRLKHNQVVYTSTLDRLCKILECNDISDIATYVPDEIDDK